MRPPRAPHPGQTEDAVLRRPLTGIRVVDFSWVRAGPWATRWMGAMGAEVVKIEWPREGPGAMGGGPRPGPAPTPGTQAAFARGGNFNDMHNNKLGVTLNVRSEEGLEATKNLIAISDIVIENFSSRVLQSWGLGYEEMRRIKPDIIYVSMAGLGHTGRNHHHQTAGPIVQALSGLTHLSGLPDQEPAGWGWSYMDDTGGLFGLMGALTALHHRNQTGVGQHVDLSQVAAAMTLLGPAWLDLTINGRGSRREGFPAGNRSVWPGAPTVNNYRGPMMVPHNAYRTHGGGYNDWCAITCADDDEWKSLVELMGSPQWATSPTLATLEGRIEHQTEIDDRLGAWAAQYGKYELTDLCQAAGVCALPVQSNEDRVEHDLQLRHQELFAPVHHPVVGTNLMQQSPFKMSANVVRADHHAPLLGEHTVRVLEELLGLPAQAVRAGFENNRYWPGHEQREPYLFEGTGLAPVPIGREAAPSVVDVSSRRYSGGALGDLRVIELANERGEWCGKLLADAGADVIKVEPPLGARERTIGPFYQDVPDPERSLHFWHYNTGKRGVTLDLETAEGRERFKQLVVTADVLLETNKAGYMDSLNLGYAVLHELNPRLVMCSLTDFGQTGPWRDFVGSDLTHMAAGGQMACCGYDEADLPDAPPIAPGGGNAWHTGSHYAYIAIMAAIAHRDFTGEGQYIDTSVHGALALTTEMHVATWIYNRQVVKRQTGRHSAASSLNFAARKTQHLCADGRYVNFGATRVTADRLPVLVAWMDSKGFQHDLDDPRFANRETVTAETDHIADLFESFIRSMPSEEVYQGAQEREFLCGAVRAPEDNLYDPHWGDRGFFVSVDHPELAQSFTYPGVAALYSATPMTVARRAPRLGEHDAEVWEEIGSTAPNGSMRLEAAP